MTSLSSPGTLSNRGFFKKPVFYTPDDDKGLALCSHRLLDLPAIARGFLIIVRAKNGETVGASPSQTLRFFEIPYIPKNMRFNKDMPVSDGGIHI
jgi:hypothetical protein